MSEWKPECSLCADRVEPDKPDGLCSAFRFACVECGEAYLLGWVKPFEFKMGNPPASGAKGMLRQAAEAHERWKADGLVEDTNTEKPQSFQDFCQDVISDIGKRFGVDVPDDVPEAEIGPTEKPYRTPTGGLPPDWFDVSRAEQIAEAWYQTITEGRGFLRMVVNHYPVYVDVVGGRADAVSRFWNEINALYHAGKIKTDIEGNWIPTAKGIHAYEAGEK